MSDHVNRATTSGLVGGLIRRTRRDASRTSIAIAMVAGFVALTTGIAFAYWSATGSGTATASTGTLNAPTGTSASSTAGSGTVSISWTAPVGGAAPSGYRVSRTPTGGSPVSACGTATTPVTNTSCSDTSVPDGTYTYVVTSILGGWTAPGAPSSQVTVTNTVATTTSVASSANPSVVGQTVTYTATVTQASGSTTPPGTVSFKDGASAISCTGGNQTLSSGTATCSVSYAGVGGHSITAVYAGSGVFTGSTSTAVAQSVNAASTTTSLTSSTNPSVTGQTVTFTATVAAVAPGSGTPTGTVAFKDGSTPITCTGGTQTLNGSGVATCQLPFSSAGARSIVATYGGSTNYLTSSSASLSQNVNSASTTTTVSSSGLASKTGQQVTYTATVAPAAPGAGTPTGTVSFNDGASPVAGCGSQALSGNSATCVITYSSIGSHTITAVYSGSTDFTTSTSSSISQVVSAAGTTTSLASSANPSVTGQSVTFTATVAASSPGAGTPTGTVTFKDGSTTIPGCDSQALSAGAATCSTNALSATTHSITAVYSGTSDYLTSTSSPLSQVVNAPVVATKFAVSIASSVQAGTNATVTITAQTASNTTATGYAGGTLSWSGTATADSPTGSAATLPTSATFTNGVATVQVNLKTAGTGLGLTVSDGTINGSTTTTVVAAPATGIGFIGATINAGTSVNCIAGCSPIVGNKGSVTARVGLIDNFGNLVAVPGPGALAVTITGTNGTLTYSNSNVNIPAGQSTSTGTVTLTRDTGNGPAATLQASATVGGTTKTVTATLNFS